MLTKNSHMSYSDRQIIETAIENGSTKQAIATTLGKDKSTIGKEIKLHRCLAYKCNLPLECANYKRCKHEHYCTLDCIDYVPFKCARRHKSPGSCNGCRNYRSCRYDKYRYSAFDAQNDYKKITQKFHNQSYTKDRHSTFSHQRSRINSYKFFEQ